MRAQALAQLLESDGGTSLLDFPPFANDPARLFPHLPGLRDLWPAIPDWEQRIQLVTSHGLGVYPIMAPFADRYQAYARVLGYTDAQTEIVEEEEVQPLGHLIDLNPVGLLQCCLQQCAPFQTPDPAFVLDVRDTKAHPPLPARHRRLLVGLLAHALLSYENGCQYLNNSGRIHGEINACIRTLGWLDEVLPLLEAPLKAVIRARQNLEGLTIIQIRQWLRAALKVLQAVMALPNGAYANMAYPFYGWARSVLDEEVSSLWQQVVGSTFPDQRSVEVHPLAYLKHLIYTRRWPNPLDQGLLLDVLLVRMHAVFQRYGPAQWPDVSIYAASAAILERFGVKEAALNPESLRKRVQRFCGVVRQTREQGRDVSIDR
jgi:hypothetical protein